MSSASRRARSSRILATAIARHAGAPAAASMAARAIALTLNGGRTRARAVISAAKASARVKIHFPRAIADP